MSKKFFDLSQPYYEGMPYAPNVGPFTIKKISQLGVDPIQVSEYKLSSHTGTHLDAPRHIYQSGMTIDQIPLERLAGRCIVINVPKPPFTLITIQDVLDSGLDVRPGDFVFFHTGCGAKFGRPEYFNHPSISLELAEWLVAKKVGIIGIDCSTVDLANNQRQPGFNFPIHHLLLENEILIIEHLNLEKVSSREIYVYCFPISIKDADGSPVRVVGIMSL
jgi:Predicted metal-dependent hydrolase